MIKPGKLKQGDKIAIISLSSGLLGEPFMVFQKELIEKRLNGFGLEVVYTQNALKGIEFLRANPERRTEDLKWAFEDDTIKGIICAIGGDESVVNSKFDLFPLTKELEGKILFLETSEEKPTPERLRELLSVLEQYGVFEVVNGVLVGKPMDEVYYDEYRGIFINLAERYDKPILFNMNFGHAHPKCILPYGAEAVVDCDNGTVTINEPIVLN